MDDSNELVTRLSTAAGIIMEDTSPIAITRLPEDPAELDERLSDLDRACQDASTLVQAAQVLARRCIR